VAKSNELPELLRRLARCQAQIQAELGKGRKAKIAAAFAAEREFATAAAPYCHAAGDGCAMLYPEAPHGGDRKGKRDQV
jgi:hypothetical protein